MKQYRIVINIMSKRSCPKYTNKHSVQTVQQGLSEYYEINPSITDPKELPPEFAQILLAHDISHVVLGCDTNMYDEIRLLPLTFWTSDFKFGDYIRTRKDPKIRPAIDIMYDDLIKHNGTLWLYSSILLVLPRLIPEIISIWFKTRGQRKYYPFLDYESLLNCSLLEIRQNFELLPFIK